MSIKLFLIAFVVMILLDLIWIGGFMTQFYKNNLKDFLRFGENGNLLPRIIPTAVVYIAAALLITIFILPHVNKSIALGNSVFVASLWGALAGLLVYAFYDFTNFALFEKWNLVVTIVDVVWGSVLFYLTTLILVTI